MRGERGFTSVETSGVTFTFMDSEYSDNGTIVDDRGSISRIVVFYLNKFQTFPSITTHDNFGNNANDILCLESWYVEDCFLI